MTDDTDNVVAFPEAPPPAVDLEMLTDLVRRLAVTMVALTGRIAALENQRKG